MSLVATLLVLSVAALHVGFLVLEMFLWTTPTGRRIFHTSPEFAQASKALAANQGLYNGFLAAGILWGCSLGDAGHGVRMFFLTCVIVAGIYGAATVNRRILLIQALPAALAIAAMYLARQ